MERGLGFVYFLILAAQIFRSGRYGAGMACSHESRNILPERLSDRGRKPCRIDGCDKLSHAAICHTRKNPFHAMLPPQYGSDASLAARLPAATGHGSTRVDKSQRTKHFELTDKELP